MNRKMTKIVCIVLAALMASGTFAGILAVVFIR